MPFSEFTGLASHKASRVAHVQNLSPCPKSEVNAFTNFGFFKFLWRLPIISPLDLAHIPPPASGKASVHFGEVFAVRL
jgi:hypothetical protein